jgi:hypothetical protein
MARWAVWSLKDDSLVDKKLTRLQSISTIVKSQANLLIFESLLFLGTLGFFYARIVSIVQQFFGIKSAGFEGMIDERIKSEIERKMPGLAIDPSVFES